MDKRHSYSVRPDIIAAAKREMKRRHGSLANRYDPKTGKPWTVTMLITEALEKAFLDDAK